ncbi:hypothetical protein [Maridesulfovibrio ferrireducens]|uniref:hypothetical protein n=1 Tax=Maridesulfovibrio ferrireducens TaxID=246191 RepID=UPI001A211512|nr:hypothetical protein [Maridesulfovibrio ferrireducens]MBI9110026.1 hypothetical protein [Maridesulfovibrio ferrireducens]
MCEENEEQEVTYAVEFRVSGISAEDYESIVNEIEMDIKMHGVEVFVGVGEPE